MSSATEIVDPLPTEPVGQAMPLPSSFAEPGLFDWLLAATAMEIDALPFGVVTMAMDGTVEHYNAAESRMAGLTQSRVLGRSFFAAVAPCMNNFMVAHRYESEPELDAVIDYVLTLRMAPKKVRLRMLKRSDARRMHLIIERRI